MVLPGCSNSLPEPADDKVQSSEESVKYVAGRNVVGILGDTGVGKTTLIARKAGHVLIDPCRIVPVGVGVPYECKS